MNYREYNRKTLKAALARLPEHQPPDNLWSIIESELYNNSPDQALHEALGQLPSYSPPPAVWQGIEKRLERQEKAPRIRGLRWLAAAASIAAVVIWSVFLLTGEPQPKPAYAYDVEQASPGVLSNNWDADEKALNAVVEAFSRDPLARRQQQYKRMLEDWRELKEAKAEIKEIMELYGKDARLVRQMGEIERQRSQLAKAMAIAI